MRLSPVEELITAANDGAPWSRADIRRAMTAADALARWNTYRAAFGAARHSSVRDFLTVANYPNRKAGNAKLEKNAVPTAGVTFLPADGVAQWARDADPVELEAFADTVGIDPAYVRNTLARLSICPRSTAGCRAGCVITQSGRAALEARSGERTGTPWHHGIIARARLMRTLLLVFDPAAALRLMLEGIDDLGAVGRAVGAPRRWRLSVADDVRTELVAPGLLTAMRANGVRGYQYTKHSPTARDMDTLSRAVAVTFSASERWKVADIVAACADGHRVAVVFDTARGEAFPASWLGARVVDGDATDDQNAHANGVIVGLRAKGSAVSGRFVFPACEDSARERMRREESSASRVTLRTR